MGQGKRDLGPRYAAADHDRRQAPVGQRQIGAQRLDGERVVTKPRDFRHAAVAAHIQRGLGIVQTLRRAAGLHGRHLARDRVDPGDTRAQKTRPVPRGEIRQPDAQLVGAVMARDQAGIHARIGRVLGHVDQQNGRVRQRGPQRRQRQQIGMARTQQQDGRPAHPWAF